MHTAAERIPSNILSKIVAVVMFGDPYDKRSGGGASSWPAALRSKALQICAAGDPVSYSILPACWDHIYRSLELISPRSALQETASFTTSPILDRSISTRQSTSLSRNTIVPLSTDPYCIRRPVVHFAFHVHSVSTMKYVLRIFIGLPCI